MKVAILDDYADAALRLADWSAVPDPEVFTAAFTSDAEVIGTLAEFDVLCVMRERTAFPRHVLEGLPNLKLIATSGTRNQAIDMQAAAELGITVCGTELRRTMTAELAMALILALERRIVVEAASLRRGTWQSAIGRDLHGLTLGLVGLGKVGQQMAVLGRAFGMDVAAWSENLTEDRCEAHGVRYCPGLADLMGRSDVVSIHVVLSERTAGLIGADAIAAMRPGASLVNTARGPIVDARALLRGLRNGRPAAAAIDVFEPEPLAPDDPINDAELMSSGKLLLTPHLGYATQQAFGLFYQQMAAAVVAWSNGEPIRVLE